MFFAREPIPFPADLEKAFTRLAARSSIHGEALRALWPKLAKARGQAVAGQQHYSFRREEAEAYAAYYLPVNCLKVPLILEEARLLGGDPLPSNADWLDFGTGPGTAYWGLAWWCARRGKQLRFTGWDQSPTFLAIARDLASAAPFPGTRAEFISGDDPLTLIRKRKPTHVSFVNSLAEIFPAPARRVEELRRILNALRDLERQDGRKRTLLLVEPGSRESSRELAALKDALHLDGSVLLPCLDARPCGALQNPTDWCHEEAACEFPPWVNELGAQAGLRKEALLFSYAMFAVVEGWQLAGASRIVSQRLERKGQVECRICTTTGKRPVRVQRSKFFFKAVRGDLWRSSEIGEKGDVVRADIVAPTPSEFIVRS
jgi:ribosomal protein RSM22 (predicted rRNA methylase)